jgi:hypothetical protein
MRQSQRQGVKLDKPTEAGGAGGGGGGGGMLSQSRAGASPGGGAGSPDSSGAAIGGIRKRTVTQGKGLNDTLGAEKLSQEMERIMAETAPLASSSSSSQDAYGGRSRSVSQSAADDPYSSSSGGGGGGGNNYGSSMSKFNFDEEQEDEGVKSSFFCLSRQPKTILGIKTDTVVRFLKVCSAFPFVIVVSALNFSNKYAFLR